jgi:hypothetical protein
VDLLPVMLALLVPAFVCNLGGWLTFSETATFIVAFLVLTYFFLDVAVVIRPPDRVSSCHRERALQLGLVNRCPLAEDIGVKHSEGVTLWP